jgi:hypothetical protein
LQQAHSIGFSWCVLSVETVVFFCLQTEYSIGTAGAVYLLKPALAMVAAGSFYWLQQAYSIVFSWRVLSVETVVFYCLEMKYSIFAAGAVYLLKPALAMCCGWLILFVAAGVFYRLQPAHSMFLCWGFSLYRGGNDTCSES